MCYVIPTGCNCSKKKINYITCFLKLSVIVGHQGEDYAAFAAFNIKVLLTEPHLQPNIDINVSLTASRVTSLAYM